MESYLPIIFHLKEIASLYKRSGKFEFTPGDCHLPAASTLEEEEKSKSLSVSKSASASPFEPVTCCGHFFRNPSHYKSHLKSIYHSKRIERTCSVCAKYFKTKKALADHSREHDPHSKFHCEVCGYVFLKQTLLLAHMRGVHRSLFSFKCKKCPFKTTNRNNLSKHVTRIHCKRRTVVKTEFKPTTCCGVTFKYQSLLKRHQNYNCKLLQSKFVCKICNEKFDRDETLIEHRRNVHNFVDGKWICMICNDSFVTKGTLTTHLNTVHIKSTVFECAKCPFSTHKKYLLARHFQNVHHNKSTFSCETCGRAFKRKDTLAAHIKNIHLSNTPRCKICQYPFRSVKEVERHELSHRPCQICGMKFRQLKEREAHIRRHLSHKSKKETKEEFILG